MSVTPSTFQVEEEVSARAWEPNVRPLLDSQGDAVKGGHVNATDIYRVLSLRLVFTDILCFLTAVTFARLIFFDFRPVPLRVLISMVAGSVIWVTVFAALGLYTTYRLTAVDEVRRTISAVCIGLLLSVIVNISTTAEISRAFVGWTLLFSLGSELVTRVWWRRHAFLLRRKGRLNLRTLVVGSDEASAQLLEALKLPDSGFLPLGHIDLDDRAFNGAKAPAERRTDKLRRLIREYRAECLFVADPGITSAEMVKLAQAARREGVQMKVYAPLSGVLSSRLTVQAVGGSGMSLTLEPARLTATQQQIKRVFDLVVASAMMLIALPVMALIALLIRLTSPGPIFFRQERVTQGGRTFQVYKFRTMRLEDEAILRERKVDRTSPFFKIKDDPRLTRLGKVLRNLSLDELPQLINVIKGEMSLVGPRPLPAEQVAANIEALGPRHEVRTGVTGWWQINGRSDVGPEEAIQLDTFYIENWSLGLDLYILARTAWVVLARTGAH